MKLKKHKKILNFLFISASLTTALGVVSCKKEINESRKHDEKNPNNMNQENNLNSNNQKSQQIEKDKQTVNNTTNSQEQPMENNPSKINTSDSKQQETTEPKTTNKDNLDSNNNVNSNNVENNQNVTNNQTNANDKNQLNSQEQIDFSDLDTINTYVTVGNRFYSQKSATSAWIELQKRFNQDIHVFWLESDITNKYSINLVDINSTNTDDSKGEITNISLSFSKDNQSKIKKFTLVGFEKSNQNNQINNKDNFLTPNQLDAKFLNLYPSLIAYMTLYSENPNKYEGIKKTSSRNEERIINFETLMNTNTDLFENDTVNFNSSLKSRFFSINEELKTKYKYSITNAKFSDSSGLLGFEVFIENSEENPSLKEPAVTKFYEFSGFKKITSASDFIISGFNLTPADFEKEINSITNLKNSIKDNWQKIENNKTLDLLPFISDFSKQSFIKKLYKKLQVNLVDNSSNRNYNVRYSDLKVSELIGISNRFSLYPILTDLSEDKIIDNFKIWIEKDDSRNEYLIKVSFDSKIAISHMNSYTDLLDPILSENEVIISNTVWGQLTKITETR
ncbi:LppA-related lipoprotein [Mycoplasma leonicaptivi]|uniref:LppA-related lipoprotein n=1 Tax=Mycoplasma leonicaptivi TaxID=36742 RepID=UPI00047FA796|nr:hypothetical protein [Mycoplasma leonicaptivi]